jgi:hypothetical protein
MTFIMQRTLRGATPQLRDSARLNDGQEQKPEEQLDWISPPFRMQRESPESPAAISQSNRAAFPIFPAPSVTRLKESKPYATRCGEEGLCRGGASKSREPPRLQASQTFLRCTTDDAHGRPNTPTSGKKAPSSLFACSSWTLNCLLTMDNFNPVSIIL